MNKIILLGYMGSGKSTIAKLLSKSLSFDCVDLDEIIEKEQHLTVKEIFQQKGEIYFRKMEHDVLKRLLHASGNTIISLGGGTPCYANNMELLHAKNTTSVYLKTSIDSLYQRLHRQSDSRPLIADKNEAELKEFIAIHLFERSYYYNQASLTVVTDDKKIEAIVAELKMLLV